MIKIIEKYISQHLDDFHVVSKCDLSTKTWIHRGGIVNFFLEPLTIEALINICRLCQNNNVVFLVVGHTSNMYFLQKDIPEVIISTRKLTLWEFTAEGKKLKCQPGVMVKRLAAYCNNAGIAGFSGFVDLPGTIAGAAVNNSSCFGSSISDILDSCTIITENGDIKVLQNEDLLYSHRNSVIKEKKIHCVILEIILNVEYSSAEALINKAKENHQKRLETQEGPNRNLGSTFAEIEYRKGYSSLMSKINRIVNILGCRHPIYWQKRILLFITGFIDLNRYISDKNMNCFIWRDSDADIKFFRYKKFINKISVFSRLEIEIIGKNS